MKKLDKNIPKRLFLKRIPMSWIDSETYVGRSDKPFDGCAEYISLSKAWHSVKEEPEETDGMIILVNCDYENPIFCDLDVLNVFCDNEETMWKEATENYEGGFWAYFKDVIPTIRKGGAK